MNIILKKKKKKRNDLENYDLERKQLSSSDFRFDVNIVTQQERTKFLLETSQRDSMRMEPARLELLAESKNSPEKKRKKIRTNKKQNYPESLDFKENRLLTVNFGSDVAVGQQSTEKPLLETLPLRLMNAKPVCMNLSTSETTAHSEELRESPEMKRKKPRTKKKQNNVDSHDLEGNQLSNGNSNSDITVATQEAEISILKTSQLESMEVELVHLDLFAPEATFHCEETIKVPERNSKKFRKNKKLNDATLLEREKSCLKTSPLESMIVKHISPDLPGSEATSNCEEISTEPENKGKKPRKKRKSMLEASLVKTSMDNARLDHLALEDTSHSEKLRFSPNKKSKRPRKNKKLNENCDLEENQILTYSFGSGAADPTQLETDIDHYASEAATLSSDLGVIPEWKRKKPRKNKKPNKPKDSDMEGKQLLNDSLLGSDAANVEKLKTNLVNIESSQMKLDRSTKKLEAPIKNLILALPCDFSKSDKDKAMKKNDILTGIESSSSILSVSNQNNQELPLESSVRCKKSKTKKNCAVSETIKATGPINKKKLYVSKSLASKSAAIYELGIMSKLCQEGCTLSLPNSENTGELELLTEFRKTKTISQEGNTSINSVVIENAELHRVSGEVPSKVASEHKVEFGIPSPLANVVSVDIVKKDNHKMGTRMKKRRKDKKQVEPFVGGENLQLFMDEAIMEKLTPLNEDEKNAILIGTPDGEGIRTKKRKKRRKKLVPSVCEENFQVSTYTVNLEKMSIVKDDDDDENVTLVSTLCKDDNTSATCARPISTTKKILLTLDLNGLLADIVESVPHGYKADIKIAKKFLFRRPFFDVFLKFCFEKFNVGVWSSRIRSRW